MARWWGLIVVDALSLAACSLAGSPFGAQSEVPEVFVTPVGMALYAPIWSYRTHALLALTDDQRLAEVADPADPRNARMRLSPPLAAGRNLQISRKNENQVYVPQPRLGKVAVVDLGSLRAVRSFDAGPAPAYLSEDAGMRVLLALSADGLSVTPVEENGYRILATANLAGAPADVIDGANRGRAIDYHVYGASGIRHYKGASSPADERGSMSMDVAVSAGDGTQVTRSYVAARNGDMLYAVDSRRGGKGLEVLAEARLSSPVRALGTDDTRIYAATDRELVVLETASFTGYPTGKIPIVHVTDYRAALPSGPVRSAPVSGLAVGPHRVYLTLQDATYVVGVAKPPL
ncbi:hypothetical protein BST27_22570 [Mycobacterium intermedium]|uniref:Uncharacterized protein n=1 Tax=Mycobacterium intermedium TaxID=28445 RepID=A0A1E3S7S6_MYCIE|nr:hypothetical protein [Mycobacterium intermedium]MCV6965412.1 hypothetical protein [Mycobacterium intermedium]ODQ98196.1 hypothetical protein BHQ20_23365 [Mycobacterium intermedium]OPE47797.1 hypothetical protein BV508_20745 [Mycobacterium intermedium]ORA97378.1 hypothetical protein BST27_22570 [Mycobacterium intermedium]